MIPEGVGRIPEGNYSWAGEHSRRVVSFVRNAFLFKLIRRRFLRSESPRCSNKQRMSSFLLFSS